MSTRPSSKSLGKDVRTGRDALLAIIDSLNPSAEAAIRVQLLKPDAAERLAALIEHQWRKSRSCAEAR